MNTSQLSYLSPPLSGSYAGAQSTSSLSSGSHVSGSNAYAQYFASDPVTTLQTTGFVQQLLRMIPDIGRSVMHSVLSFFGQMFGSGIDPKYSALSLQGSVPSDALMSIKPYASTKKPETFWDKVISWFKTAGDLGHDISNGIKDGRDTFAPILTGLDWGWDKLKSIAGGIGENIGKFFGFPW